MLKEALRTKAALEMIGGLLVSKYKAQMEVDKTVASSEVKDSFRFSVNGLTLSIIASKAVKYIDKGTKPGKYPPVNEILKWADDKGLRPRGKGGKFIANTIENRIDMATAISIAIGRKGTIKRFGYKGSGIIQFVLDQQKAKITKELYDAYKVDLENELNSKIKKNN